MMIHDDGGLSRGALVIPREVLGVYTQEKFYSFFETEKTLAYHCMLPMILIRLHLIAKYKKVPFYQ